MTLSKTATVLTTLALTLGAPLSPAMAGPSASAWGTKGASSAQGALYSAQLHKAEGDNAQVETIGRDVVNMYRNITSCGVCVYNTITGDSNSITGNTIDGSNTGAITATGRFSN